MRMRSKKSKRRMVEEGVKGLLNSNRKQMRKKMKDLTLKNFKRKMMRKK